MKKNLITQKQFTAAIFVAILSPVLRTLPKNAVLLAGKGAWLSILPAFAVLLLFAFIMGSLHKRMRPGEGLSDLFLRFFGPFFGRVALIFYSGWFLFYGGFILRSGAARKVATVYLESPQTMFIVVTLALCLLIALGTLRATARTAVIFLTVLLSVLVLVFVAAAPDISMKNLFPLHADDSAGIVRGSFPIISVGGAAALFGFISGYAEQRERPVRWIMPRLLLFLLLAGFICFEVVGIFGAGLTTRLSYSFFIMVRDISIFNVAPRIEAVVILVWVFADSMICSLLLRCAHESIRGIFSLPDPESLPMKNLKKGRWLLWVEAGVMLCCALLFPAATSRLAVWSDTYIPLISDAFTLVGLSVLWCLSKVRKNA